MFMAEKLQTAGLSSRVNTSSLKVEQYFVYLEANLIKIWWENNLHDGGVMPYRLSPVEGRNR